MPKPSPAVPELTPRIAAARQALLHQQPAETLALLDETWPASQDCELGWFLRGSALAQLGLPGEAQRICREGVQQHPRSIALPFLARQLRQGVSPCRTLPHGAVQEGLVLIAGGACTASRALPAGTAAVRPCGRGASRRELPPLSAPSLQDDLRGSAAIRAADVQAPAAQTAAVRRAEAGGAGSRTAKVAAVGCVAAAMVAMGTGYPIIALPLAGGASWLAFRRVQRLNDTAEYRATARHAKTPSR
jgi:hypothetical protein